MKISGNAHGQRQGTAPPFRPSQRESSLRLLVLSSYLPAVGGGELQTALQLRTLRRMGHRVEVVDLSSKPHVPRRETRDDIPVFRPWRPRVPILGTACYHVSLALLIWRKLSDASVVHFNHIGPPLLTAKLLCRMRRVPLVLVVWGSSRPGIGPFRPGLKWSVLRRLARRHAPVVALGVSNAHNLQRVGFPADSIRVIPNGVDVERFSPAVDKREVRKRLGLGAGPVAITVGRLVEAKGYDVLLRAWRLVLRDLAGARLVLVGGGPKDGELRELARELGIQAQVDFAGVQRNVEEWLAACDVYVSSSRTEGMSNSILEALVSGLPVVATRVGAAVDVIRPGVNGELVPASEPEALSAAIIAILGDASRREVLSRNARAQAIEDFGIQPVVRQYVSLYQALISGEPRLTR